MTRRITVPLDGSQLAERALWPAQELAERAGAGVDLVSVVRDLVQVAPRAGYLNAEADGLQAPRTIVEVVQAENPSDGILQATRPEDGAIVCMATHGRGALGRLLRGSVAETLLRSLPGYALLVGSRFRADRPTTFETLVIGLDGSDYSKEFLRPAARWGRELGMRMILVRVNLIERRPVPLPADVREDGYLAGLAMDLRAEGIRAEWDVLHGYDVARTLAGYAEQLPGPVLALRTHCRTGIARLRGSVAMKAVRLSPFPVLVACTSCTAPESRASGTA
jgi:nucleotide-binding universal stress UspA family protein